MILDSASQGLTCMTHALLRQLPTRACMLIVHGAGMFIGNVLGITDIPSGEIGSMHTWKRSGSSRYQSPRFVGSP